MIKISKAPKYIQQPHLIKIFISANIYTATSYNIIVHQQAHTTAVLCHNISIIQHSMKLSPLYEAFLALAAILDPSEYLHNRSQSTYISKENM